MDNQEYERQKRANAVVANREQAERNARHVAWIEEEEPRFWLAEDGYSDGGERYSDEELEQINAPYYEKYGRQTLAQREAAYGVNLGDHTARHRRR